MCSNSILCSNLAPKNYFLLGSSNSLKPIGIALDGHIIYGPFKDSTSLWQPCDVDICNGKQINGNYGYVISNFHPYTIGCWGPGDSSSLSQSTCTTNPRSCSPV